MKIFRIAEDIGQDVEDPWWYDSDDESQNERIQRYRSKFNELKSINDVKVLIPNIVDVAQREYNEWDESNVDVYAGGGICHFIADQIASILIDHGIECFTQSSSFEQHVYCIVQVREGIYVVDIHYSIYETGGGFSWNKRPDVSFDDNDITISQLSGDFDDISEYIEDYEDF